MIGGDVEVVATLGREGVGDCSQQDSKNSSRAKSRRIANCKEKHIKTDRKAEKKV